MLTSIKSAKVHNAYWTRRLVLRRATDPTASEISAANSNMAEK